MNRLLKWLQEHKVANILILSTYFLAVVLPHKLFGSFLNKTVIGALGIDNNSPEGRAQYNALALALGVIILVIVLTFFIRNTRNQIEGKRLRALMVLNTFFAAIIVQFLFVVNIEMVHFPQYALFAILLFPLVGNYTSTLIWATLAGMIDEAYQYFYLAPMDTAHYDFNDVLTNCIGAIFGLLFLRSFGTLEGTQFRLKRSTSWIGLALIIMSVLVFHLAGVLSIYPSEVHDYHIVREMPAGFWSKVHPNVTYHVVRPIEGILITISLWIIFHQSLKVRGQYDK